MSTKAIARTVTTAVIIIVVVLLTASLSLAGMSYKSRFNSDFASAFYSGECSGVNVNVGRWKEDKETYTEFSYYAYSWCNGNSISAHGEGRIPNDAYTGNAKGGKVSLSIDFNALNLQEFQYEGPPLSSANLIWQKDGQYRVLVSQHNKYQYKDGVSETFNRHSTDDSATVSGIISIPSVYEGPVFSGTVSDNGFMDREIEKGNK